MHINSLNPGIVAGILYKLDLFITEGVAGVLLEMLYIRLSGEHFITNYYISLLDIRLSRVILGGFGLVIPRWPGDLARGFISSFLRSEVMLHYLNAFNHQLLRYSVTG